MHMEKTFNTGVTQDQDQCATMWLFYMSVVRHFHSCVLYGVDDTHKIYLYSFLNSNEYSESNIYCINAVFGYQT